jgi:glucokinase
VNSQAVIALDLGGTKLASALFDPNGRILTSRTALLEGRTGTAVGELVAQEVTSLKQLAGEPRSPGPQNPHAIKHPLDVSAIGICVPGIVHPKTGGVWAPNIPGWDDYSLPAEIRSAIADSDLHVVIENDRAASILGEAWQGAARGCKNAIFLAVGTGIGAGILLEGRVVRGAQGIAGAIGWLALDRPFRKSYTSCGCFESNASGDGIAKVAAELVQRRSNYRGVLRNSARITAKDVFEAFDAGDEVAKEVLAEAVEFWGMASANLISLFNPEKLIFGGGVFGPATRFLDAIAAEARRWAQPIAIQQVSFEASQLAGDAALYGVAYAALQRSKRS